MLDVNKISYSVSQRKLFEGASFKIPSGYHVGLVGQNGIGKTTLFNLIDKSLGLDEGTINIEKNKKVSLLEQEIPQSDLSILEYVIASDSYVQDLINEFETSVDQNRILELSSILEDLDAFKDNWKASYILSGLGFHKNEHSKKLSELSGGWRNRVGLAASLYSNPDLLLLDEPTNHLDFESVVWFENFLRDFSGTFIMISHDRQVLNNTVDHILHVENLGLNLYTGNYDQFESQLAQKNLAQDALYKKQQIFKNNVMRYVNKFGAKATKAKQAQSRLRALEKLDLVDAVISERSITFTFPQPKNLGSSMLLINQVEVGYNKSPVLKDINLSISNDSRIALVGANGNGKSTLIKLIYGNITPMSGQIIRNKKLKIGYFAQHQTDELDVTKTAYEIISDLDKEKPDLFLRGVLGRFGFDKEKSETLVEKLSGGEKTRLLFCIMSYHSPDLLLLDEPTNHLDIDSRISLINSLNAFEGAIILVSHDNDIIEKVTDQILVVSDGKVESFSEDLLNYKLYIKDQFDPTKNKNKNKSSNKKIKKIETEINKLVLKKEEIEIEMSLPKNLDKFETLSNLSDEYQLINKEIKKLENDWINENAQ
ncbi:MAG: ABC-F family ATP-binding cassette domain-containing protein [Dehalococcoidia bacterium]|nr:glycosyl transferase family 1 [Chloroflexota bacterium]RZP13282.1 MAG: ABC transporter ATP-binding protein [Chloroflexota bacterium]|tara:strand:+ start:14950 stop:16740 length:1791 start_codon:yes stop_codon:yes gene_type:complete